MNEEGIVKVEFWRRLRLGVEEKHGVKVDRLESGPDLLDTHGFELRSQSDDGYYYGI